MWIVYNKNDRKIIGLTADSDTDIEKAAAIEEVSKGTVNKADISEFDAIQITDRIKASQYLHAFPRRLAIVGSQSEPKVTIREPESFSLFLTTDAPDVHPVDGIPEIAADGQSSALITIQKIDERYKPQNAVKDDDVIYLRTDYGILKDETGTLAINNIKLNHGSAKIRLYSEIVKRVSTINFLSTKQELKGATIQIEFI